MNLKQRLEAVERTLGGQPLTLNMPDGTTRPVNRRRLSVWFREIFSGGELSPDTAALVDAIGDNGTDGLLPELLRAVALSPIGTETEHTV